MIATNTIKTDHQKKPQIGLTLLSYLFLQRVFQKGDVFYESWIRHQVTDRCAAPLTTAVQGPNGSW